MPSTGFHSFLPMQKDIEGLKDDRVNALNGLPFISTTLRERLKLIFLEMCQCPQRASIHFYRAKRGTIVLNKRVNALNGLPFISTKNRPSADDWRRECQCPQRASIHFYHRRKPSWSRTLCVSMPSTGFHSFLHMFY